MPAASPSSRVDEWLKFLRIVDQTVAREKQIHIICDNYATHKHERMQRWIVCHKLFHMHFTPTSASRLNMIERCCANTQGVKLSQRP